MKLRRYSNVELLVALLLLFVTAPFVEDLPNGNTLEVVLMTVVMISSVLAVGGGRGNLIVAVVLLLPALAAKWLNHLRPELLHPAVYFSASMVFFVYIIAQLLRFIVRSPRVDLNVLCGGVSGYLILGLSWTPAYLALDRIHPGSFNLPGTAAGVTAVLDPYSAFYFSFTTLCTVGYGDITPASNAARMLAVLESITGLFYMAVLISRLVSLHASMFHTGGASKPPTN